MADRDSNTWYSIIYSNADYSLSQGATGKNDDPGPRAVFVRKADYSSTAQQWQILRLNTTEYVVIRSRHLGPAYNLGAYSCIDQGCASITECAMQPSGDIDAVPLDQQWLLQDNQGTTTIASRVNGTSAYLDAFALVDVGLNTAVDSTSVSWTVSPVGQINDVAFSVMAVAPTSTSVPSSPTSTSQVSSTTSALSSPASSSVSSSSPNSSGLSTGAKAGIGVSVAILVLALMAVFSFLLRKRKAQRSRAGTTLDHTPTPSAKAEE